jgi:hypothetical protein
MRPTPLFHPTRGIASNKDFLSARFEKCTSLKPKKNQKQVAVVWALLSLSVLSHYYISAALSIRSGELSGFSHFTYGCLVDKTALHPFPSMKRMMNDEWKQMFATSNYDSGIIETLSKVNKYRTTIWMFAGFGSLPPIHTINGLEKSK